MSVVTMKSLLESGVHFGHQTRRWDPKMAPYIFAERNGIHIIDLQKTMVEINKAYDAVKKAVLQGKSVLFVGTKKQARAAIQKEAERCGQFYVNNRWLGGMLTNFVTIRQSILRLKKIEKMEVDGTFESLPKKERLGLLKEKSKLEQNLGGIKNMDTLPGIVFIVDSKKEAIAVAEARKLKIPIVAIVDTNCNPNEVDYPIPGNDDAIRAIELFCSIIANACLEASNEAGINIISDKGSEEEKELKDSVEEESDSVEDTVQEFEIDTTSAKKDEEKTATKPKKDNKKESGVQKKKKTKEKNSNDSAEDSNE